MDRRGRRFFFAPALLLGLGFVRGELTSLLWGGAFGFAWCYVIVARLLTARHVRVRRPQGRLDRIPGGSLVFTTPAPPPVPAFFQWSWRFVAVHSATRQVTQAFPLTSRSETAIDWPRGHYEVTAQWVLEDLLGFTHFVSRTAWNLTVVCEPASLPFSPPPPPTTRPGPWRPRRTGRRAGDPFDVRPYTPGDDLRRLHWPLYAHSDVPFVRTAEPSPPPTGHEFLVLDTAGATEAALDDRLGRLMTWLAALDAQGTRWTLVLPAQALVVTAEPGPVLARLTPAPLPDLAIPNPWPESVTVVTVPGSSGAQRLGQRLASTRRRYRLVELPLPPDPPAPVRPWWRRPQ